jgi:hypothetical protein
MHIDVHGFWWQVNEKHKRRATITQGPHFTNGILNLRSSGGAMIDEDILLWRAERRRIYT